MLYLTALLKVVLITAFASILWYYKANIYIFGGFFAIYTLAQAIKIGKLQQNLNNLMGYLR